MAVIGELATLITARADPFNKALNQAGRSVGGFVNTVKAKLAPITNSLTGIAGGLSAAAFVGFGVKAAADAEKAQVAYATLIGSVEKAKRLMADLQQFSVVTPFTPEQVREAGQTLLAFNIDAQQIIGTMQVIGDVAASSGADLTSVGRVIGEVFAKGKADMQDLRQLVNQGIAVFPLLQKHLGLTGSQLAKFISDGKVSFQILFDVLQKETQEGGKFFGAMENQSKTLLGVISTIQGNFTALAQKVGEALLPLLKDLAGSLNRMLVIMSSLNPETASMVVKIGLAVAAFGAAVVVISKVIGVIKLLVSAYRALATSQAIVQALSGPKGWALLAAGAVAAAAAVAGVSAMMDKVGDDVAVAAQAADEIAKIGDAAQVTGNAIKDAADEQERLAKLMDRGKTITEQMRTPLEVFKDSVTDLDELLAANAISWKTYSRAVEDAQKKLDAATESADKFRNSNRSSIGGVAATQRGSSAAFSAERAASSNTARLAELQRQQLAESQKQTSLLRSIRDKAGVDVVEAKI